MIKRYYAFLKGCLMMEDKESHDLLFLNILSSMKTIQLPKVEFDYQKIVYMLWQDPDDSNYHIWFINRKKFFDIMSTW